MLSASLNKTVPSFKDTYSVAMRSYVFKPHIHTYIHTYNEGSACNVTEHHDAHASLMGFFFLSFFLF